MMKPPVSISIGLETKIPVRAKRVMGVSPIMVKKLSLIFLIMLVSAFSVSFAGRPSILVYTHINLHDEMVEPILHERLLRMNTNDYGDNSPSPRLERPPFKLIPN
ncbi:Protein CASPARIAN STRIP INTEGRITY FACTOR 1 [Cardamine amara subsp. amara]|uniref:Protein CASPARIAN STRIP INTEGRITY FACTOR 1 n=1 Tax=Cardamine amara subsp. amara TaxID=228776 RepID=A0ABD1C1K4_CARAN